MDLNKYLRFIICNIKKLLARIFKMENITEEGGPSGLSMSIGLNKSSGPSGTPWENTRSLQTASSAGNNLIIPDNASHSLSTDISYAGWVQIPGSGTRIMWSQQNGGTGLERRFSSYQTSGAKWGVILFDNIDGSTVRKNYESTFNLVSSPTWNHFCFTFGSATLRMYHNGVELTVGGGTLNQITNTALPSLYDSARTLNWGGQDSGAFGLGGLVSDCAIYDKALTPAEVAAIYNTSTPNDLQLLPSNSNLIHFWPVLPSDTGGTVEDVKGGLNGTYGGGAGLSTTVP